MVLYRIALRKHIKDLSGSGAQKYGGRWNYQGVAVIYTSESISLATIEYLVHLPLFLASRYLMVATIKIPDNIIPSEVHISSLPKNWRQDPAPPALAEIGAQWVNASKSLLLRVPSSVIDKECNILINPAHADMKHVSIINLQPFKIDERLLREQALVK